MISSVKEERVTECVTIRELREVTWDKNVTGSGFLMTSFIDTLFSSFLNFLADLILK